MQNLTLIKTLTLINNTLVARAQAADEFDEELSCCDVEQFATCSNALIVAQANTQADITALLKLHLDTILWEYIAEELNF